MCECDNPWVTYGGRARRASHCSCKAVWFQNGKFLCDKHCVKKNGGVRIAMEPSGRVVRRNPHEVWMMAKTELLRGGQEPHFHESDIGRYFKACDLEFYFTGKIKESLIVKSFGYYQVMAPHLDDEHIMWLMLKGAKFCPLGKSSKLKLFADYTVRFLSQQGHWVSFENTRLP